MKSIVWLTAFTLIAPLFESLAAAPVVGAGKSTELVIPLHAGEQIWSGIVKDGHKLPYAAGYRYDFHANNQDNQIQPLLLGNKGLWIWSEEPYAFEIGNDRILITQARER